MTTQIVESRPAPSLLATVSTNQQSSKPLAISGQGCPNLSQALAAARDRCRSAAKTSRNEFHRYDYASADVVIATANEALAGSGLAVIPTAEELRVIGAGNQSVFVLDRTLFLSHASGEFVPLEIRGWPVIPDKGRPLDKAYAAALSSSLAYKLRDLLQMPRGEENDIASRDDRHHEPSPPPVTATEPAPIQEPKQATNGTSPKRELITPEQRQTLASIYREKNCTATDVQTLLASVNVASVEELPASLFDWAVSVLTDGQVSTEQIDRIILLAEQRKISFEAIDRRIREKHGVRLRMLTRPQADEIEKALAGK